MRLRARRNPQARFSFTASPPSAVTPVAALASRIAATGTNNRKG